MENKEAALASDRKMVEVLRSSLYPGADAGSVMMVLDYCRAAGLDPLQKPVHIVPLWDSKAGGMRDVIMPGIGLYRIQAARTGQFAGMSEPEFGSDVTSNLGGQPITYPEWCRVTVKRALASGVIAEFTAKEFWVENYAVKGGKDRSIAANAMWTKRPRGQIAKCASAQAMRIAFPELGAQPAAEEMEGKAIDAESYITHGPCAAEPDHAAMKDLAEDAFNAQKTAWREAIESGRKKPCELAAWLAIKKLSFTDSQKNEVESWVKIKGDENEDA